MTHADRRLVLLAATALALVAGVLWQGRREYVRDPPALTGLDPGGVTRIELDMPPAAPQQFVRRAHGGWRIQPSDARGDENRVGRLAKLAATPVVRWIPADEIKPAKVGLARPSATLVLDGTRLEYGGLTAIDDLRYVRVGNRIALVPRQYSPEVTLSSDHP